MEGPLDAAAHEHGDLVKQLRETEAIAELLKRLHKVNDATVIQYLRNFLWITYISQELMMIRFYTFQDVKTLVLKLLT